MPGEEVTPFLHEPYCDLRFYLPRERCAARVAKNE
jgi:hypothetical protein